jgi:flavin reductase (DIM6/NTAB) family NADH-FMN oxidoreductase RutF
MTRAQTSGRTGPELDGAALRQAFGRFPSGVITACALLDDQTPQGMTVSAFVSASLDPPLVLLCIQRTSTTWPALARRPRIGLSVLAEQHGPVSRSLAARYGDRFAGVDWRATPSGAVFVHGSTLWLNTSIEAEHPAGDHIAVLLRIHEMEMFPDVAPLVFFGSKFRLLAAER